MNDPFTPKHKESRAQMVGGSYEEDIETEGESSFVSPFFETLRADSAVKTTTGVFKDLFSAISDTLVKDIAGFEPGKPMSATGEMRFNNPEQQRKLEEQEKKAAIQSHNASTIAQAEQQHEVNKMVEAQNEIIRVVGVGIPLEDFNKDLGYNASYQEPAKGGAYYIFNYRAKQIEDQKQTEKEAKAMEAQTVNAADPLNGHMLDTNAENQRLSNAVG